MRRSSSTSSTCGASSAGCGGFRARVAAWATVLFLCLCSCVGGTKYSLQHLVGIVVVDHRAQELPDNFRLRRTDLPQRAVDAVGLQASELAHQRLSLCAGEKKTLPLVVVAGLLHDIPFIEQLLENPSQRLLGDAQHVQQIGHLQAGITVDEMHDTVMRPSEPESLQLMIGVTDEITVGEEQQLDDIPAQIAGPGVGGAPFAGPRVMVGRCA